MTPDTLLFERLSDVDVNVPVALTIGTFDGVHLAHHALIATARSRAAEIGGKSAVLTFQNHPREVVHPEHAPKLLTTWPVKRELIINEGVDILVGIPFDEELSHIEAREFVLRTIAERFHARVVISGPDFHFGRGGEGNKTTLNSMSTELGFQYECQEPILKDGTKLSSTRIRGLLNDGNVKEAAALLGRRHLSDGTVVTGDQIGRTIGFPTANLRISERQLLPSDGVYVVEAQLENNTLCAGMMNIGWRPTVEGKDHRIEVHLLDFEGELEGQVVRVHFIDRIRDEQRFDGIDALRNQLELDRNSARAIYEQS